MRFDFTDIWISNKYAEDYEFRNNTWMDLQQCFSHVRSRAERSKIFNSVAAYQIEIDAQSSRSYALIFFSSFIFIWEMSLNSFCRKVRRHNQDVYKQWEDKLMGTHFISGSFLI